MITQVKVGQKYINASVAITNDDGVAIDPTSAEVWFYKISQVNGAITLDTNINGTGKVPLSKQDGQIGFYGTSIEIASFLETEYVVLYKVTAELAETITVEYLSIDSTKYQISDIWNYANRSLTTFGNLVSDIWNYSTRTLTSLGTLVSDIAVAVWTYATRTITAGGITAAEIWSYSTRTLTSLETLVNNIATAVWSAITRTLIAGTKDSEIDAIKIQTDKITDLDTQIKRILGLTSENYRVTSFTYSGELLTAATIKIYPTKADVLADTNALAIYSMIATYDIDGKSTGYRVTKE